MHYTRNTADAKQMNLGELITALERIQLKNEYDLIMRFDFVYFSPTKLASWRGAYEELAIGYSEHDETMLSEFLELCRGAMGATFDGYKGGKYTMTSETPIWIANYRQSGNTALVGVDDKSGMVILHTTYMEY